MNYDEESYNSAVNAQWERLAQAQTKEEIQTLLNKKKKKRDFEIEAQSDEVDKDKNEG